MRLGGRIFEKWTSPEQWVELHRQAGYRATYCPVEADADDATIQAYCDAAAQADLVIAEVGAWSNPISPNDDQREKALAKCRQQLELAERIGARCCVNIAGSRNAEDWHGPHALNFSQETFDMIVESVRNIIDHVKPTRTVYSLEMMSWVWPDSADQYLQLAKAIDRPAFGIHVDPVNIINSPARYFDNAKFVTHTIKTLGSSIRSVHIKDVTMSQKQLVHIDECRPGMGQLDYTALLRALNQLEPDLPIMLEHLPNAGEYQLAADHLRSVAQQEGIEL